MLQLNLEGASAVTIARPGHWSSVIGSAGDAPVGEWAITDLAKEAKAIA